MVMLRTDSPPCTSAVQEDRTLSSRASVKNMVMITPTTLLCRIKNAVVRLDFSAALFAALAVLSIVAAALWPERTADAYCLRMARFCCHRDRGLLASWGLSWMSFWYSSFRFVFSSRRSALAAWR